MDISILDMSQTRKPTKSRAPLKPAVFHILLALSKGELHGLGIADEVERANDGTMRLGPGTLYRSLKTMIQDRLIRETHPPEPDEDPRRKFYRITAEGRKVLQAEAERYEQIVRIARGRDVLPGVR